jgi:3'-5' exoribonuclease 1
MNYIILDLEATCWETKKVSPNEIIEIGAVCINPEKQLVGEFCSFVKPSINPLLSEFCTQLTSITQENVDAAPLFPEAVAAFQSWILSFGNDYLLCSWGYYDQTQLIQDCKAHNIAIDWLDAHISIKHQYSKIKNTRSLGMKAALAREELTLEGTHHRGIDDAKNIVNIFLKLWGQWKLDERRTK